MSKSDKLLTRLRAIPADFSWDELVTALSGLGFVDASTKPGSYRTFLHSSGKKIFLHKPHPSPIVKRYALRQVVQKLEEFGI